jgi:hypothetical protein
LFPATSHRHSNNGSTTRTSTAASTFDWQTCVDALKPRDLVRLGNERWYSRAFCQRLREERRIGLFRADFAFPVKNNGTIVGTHYRFGDDWPYFPSGIKTAPLIIGDLANSKQVHVGESPWDMLSLADRTDCYKNESIAFIATRGSENAKLLKGLIPQGASVCAWPQNDKPGEKWLNDLSAFVPGLAVTHVPVSIRKANEFGEAVEVKLKDLNDWIKAGASPEAIYKAWFRNELYEPPRPADLGLVLEKICDFLRRHIVCSSPAQPLVIALWIAHTWVLDAFDYTPYLHPWSPEKRCGKTKLLDCLELLVAKPWRAVSPSEAVLYRKIELDQPTLLLDEVDTIFSGNKDERKEPLRALLNAGFERKAKVPRCVGQGSSYRIQEFAVFCPKALAGIGRLPDTVGDRCVPIRLIRRSREETIERFRKRNAEAATLEIRESLASWAQQPGLAEELRAAQPETPVELDDRQADICEPLLAIADKAGDEWSAQARHALIELCTNESEEEESIGIRLLSDIRNIFDSKGADRLATQELLDGLVELETDAPWATWWEEDLKKGNTRGPARKLAQLLKRYKIQARVIRLPDDSTPRGYMQQDFEEAWKRYCPLSP